MKINRKTTLEFDDYILSYENNENAKLKFKSTLSEEIFYHKCLKTGHLFYNFKVLNGYFFLDNYDSFYDTNKKKCYFSYYDDSAVFIGEEDKEAFILFENQNLIEQKIKEGIDKMKKTPNEKDKDEIQNNFVIDLINELENFDIKNFKFKNGKYYYRGFKSNEYLIIHDNKFEKYRDGVKIYEGDFIYSYDYKFKSDKYYLDIFIEPHGNIKFYNENNYEYFYNQKIGRGKIKDDKNEKFFCQIDFDYLDYIFEDSIIIKKNNEERNNNLGIILVKGLNKEIIYDINVKINNKKTYDGDKYIEPEGIGLVKDNRNGEILIVNFDNNNILSKNLQDLSLFIDKQNLK